MEYKILLDLAIILVVTKIFGLFTRTIRLPQVVGALLAGIVIGPACLNLFQSTDVLSFLAELGVILIMFTAGMETDLSELKKCWKAALVIASVGVVVPLVGGLVLAYFFGEGILRSIFIGVILTATSVGITVETLQELKKLKTLSGTAILGAAIIDDILGIIILSVIMSFSGGSHFSVVAMGTILIKIVLFFILAVVLGYIALQLLMHIIKSKGRVHRLSIFALAFCLLMAYLAEQFGIADITGAYMAGLMLSNSKASPYIEEKTEVLSYLFFSPIFFASIGLKISFAGLNAFVLMFSLLLLVVAIVSKVAGCGFGAKLCGFSTQESLQIGVGMISRGEVALIVANKGMLVGLMNPALFSGVVVVVIVTTLITPILLKMAYNVKEQGAVMA